MSRPTIDRTIALGYLASLGLDLATEQVALLGVRGGLSKSGQNAVGVFDDLIVVVTEDLCEAFTGNTDPSSEVRYRANLRPGVFPFRLGTHHPHTPQAYPCFVQDGPISVFRFGTEDVLLDTHDDEHGWCLGNGMWKGLFEIHIHNAMGENTTGSEGCQTIIKHEWSDFWTMMSGQLRAFGKQSFSYGLVEV